MFDISLAMLGVLLAICWFYCFLAIQAILNYNRTRYQPSPEMPFISVLLPLDGPLKGMLDRIRCFFDQDYPEFEILMGAEHADDPAVSIANQVVAENPKTPAQLIVVGAAPGNWRRHAFHAMLGAARYDLLLVAGGSVRAGPDLLRVVSAEIERPGIELVTCPFRTIGNSSIWSTAEAIGWNAGFFTSLLLARFTKKFDFDLGKAAAIRRGLLDRIGGFGELERNPAAGSTMGRRVTKAGGRILLSALAVENVLPSESFADNMRSRLRNAATLRRAHPWLYVFDLFLNPLPFALLLFALWPHTWPVLALTAGLRALVAWLSVERALHIPLTSEFWYLLPLQDLAGLLVWIGGWFRFGPGDYAFDEGLPARPRNPDRG